VRRLTLTFDNGPAPGTTERVLDELGARGVPACFFVVGAQLARPGARALAERAFAEGHRVGNHTMTHSVPLGERHDAGHAVVEIDACQSLLGSLVDPERLFRPFGRGGAIGPHLLSREALAHLRDGAYTLVLWNSLPRDWENPEGWVEAALADVRSHDWTVVVLHDLPTGAMAALPRFLDAVKAEGVTLTADVPDACAPLRRGVVTGDVSGLVADRVAGA
jgi:peptidoglycan/xylan/chitin deacetylase (PgdA/CDA1 family)